MGLLNALDEQFDVWLKGHVIPGYNSSIWRRDDFGHAMKFSDYGNRDSVYGWEIDHITPSALGGFDVLANKRPRHWKSNCTAGGILGNALADWKS